MIFSQYIRLFIEILKIYLCKRTSFKNIKIDDNSATPLPDKFELISFLETYNIFYCYRLNNIQIINP